MKIHAIQTGIVHVKSDFLRGSVALGSTASFMIHLFTDRKQVDLPIYCWVIEHDEGVIVIDTGERSDTNTNFITQSTFTIRPEEDIRMQLERLGIRPKDVSKVILTHLHGDHIDGVTFFEGVPVFIGAQEYAFYRSGFGGTFTRLTTRLPKWFEPKPLILSGKSFGTFDNSYPITKAGDIVAVPTPGHTGGHISVIAIKEDIHYFLAGDMTYDQQALLDQRLQGPTIDKVNHPKTLQHGLDYARSRPTVYLPAHDWGSGDRLANRQTILVASSQH